MTNKFTKKAENALKRAVEYSGELGHTYIGTEHILMGLDSDSESVSAKILSSHGVDLESIKKVVIEVSGRGVSGTVRPDDMTPGAKNIIEQSAANAKRVSQKFIGTEHILLALVTVGECVGARILEMLKVSLHELKDELTALTESADINRKISEGQIFGAVEVYFGRRKVQHDNAAYS